MAWYTTSIDFPGRFAPENGREQEFTLVLVSLLIPYFVSFYQLVSYAWTSVNGPFQGCWAYLQDCDKFYFLQALPFGYSQTIFYAGIFLVFLIAAEGIIKKKWSQVWWMLFMLFLWKIFVDFIIGTQPGNFEYYDLVFSFIVLFLPFRSWFLRLSFVFLYFLASTIKFHEGWVLGTYFTSLQNGLAIFGDALAPVFTIVVIIMQMIGSWFLLSQRGHLRAVVFFYFFCFHVYSGVYVGWRYLSSDLFMLSTLFYLHENPKPVPFNRRSMFGYFFLFLLLLAQLSPKLIPGDQKFTLEANNFGLYMFEANHQCISTVRVNDATANYVVDEHTRFSVDAKSRCNPLFYLQRIKKICATLDQGKSVSWTFDHSVNGGPFFRMIDEENACVLQYAPFSHNTWIKYDREKMEIVGYPLKNYYF